LTFIIIIITIKFISGLHKARMKPVKIMAGIDAVDLVIHLKKENIVVIGDVHLGYEEAMTKQGILMPRFQFKDTIERLEKIFSTLKTESKKLEAVVVNGDLKHEFGSISDQEWREILKLIDFFMIHSKQVILIKGNHDVKLSPIARKRDITLVENIAINDKFICHGHVVPESKEFEKAKTLIVGNEHPAVSLSDETRKETYKCFLLGKWNKKKMIVMPSFNQITIGTDILNEDFISPFMKQDLSNFELFVVGNETFHFGKVKNVK
jgi:uncharacterized protein